MTGFIKTSMLLSLLLQAATTFSQQTGTLSTPASTTNPSLVESLLLTGCGDDFFDPGGPDSNYTDNVQSITTICPTLPGQFVEVNFSQFETALGEDYLTVYSGSSTNNLLTQYSGSYMPSTISSYDPSGCLTFLFHPFGSQVAAGWEATVACADCPRPNQLRVYETSPNAARIYWWYYSGAVSYQVEVGLPGFAPGTGESLISQTVGFSEAFLQGLQGNTSYEAYVRIVCSNGQSAFEGPLPFRTAPGCGETFTDPSGPDSNFVVQHLSPVLVCPEEPETFVSVDFQTFDMPGSYGPLYIYDGLNGSYMGAFSNDAPPAGPITATNLSGGCLYFVPNVNYAAAPGEGWEASISCVTCPQPYNLTATGATPASVDLNWTTLGMASFYRWELGLPGFVPGTGADVASGNTSSGFINVAGLESGTFYEAYVRTQCWNGDTSIFFGPVLFSTSPECGDTFYDLGGPDGNYPAHQDVYTTICPDEPGQFVQASFSEFDLDPCCTWLEIRDGAYWWSPPLGYYTGSNSPGTVAANSPDGCLTFHFYSGASSQGAGWEAAISCVTCPVPSSFRVDQTSTEHVQLAWNLPYNADYFHWEVGPPGFTPGTGSGLSAGNVNSNLILVTGLESGTTYHAWLKSVCSSSDQSAYVGPLVFTTNPSCGDYFQDTGGENGNTPTHSYTTTICPDVPGTFVQLEFDTLDLGTCCSSLSILDGEGHWGSIIGYYLQQANPGIVAATNPSGCLTFSFHASGSPGLGWGAEVNCITCPQPYQLAAANAQNNSIQLSWSHQGGNLANFAYEVGLPGFTPGNGESVAAGNVNFNYDHLSNLEGGTTYEFYVRSNCLGAAGASGWAGPFAFTTLPTCGDVFTDSGGADGNYSEHDYFSVNICPDQPGEFVQIDFTEFSIPACCGTLAFYDASGWLGTFNGSELPPAITSNGFDGCLNVHFAAGGQPGEGWVADITCVSCPAPNRVSMDYATSTSARFNWNYISTAASYYWEVGPAGFQPETGQHLSNGTTTDHAVETEGLENNTEYDFYIRLNCPNGAASGFAGPIRFTTAPSCGDSFYDPAGPDSSYVSGGLHFITVICPDSVGQAVAVSFDTLLIHPWEDYLHVYNGIGTSNALIGTYNGMTPEPGTFTATNPDGCLTFLLSANGGGVWEGWEAQVNCISCPAVSGLLATSVTPSSAELIWNASPVASAYQWELGVPGFVPGAGNALFSGTSSTNTVTASGLSSGQSYELYVRPICGSDSSGVFGSPLLFATAITCGGYFYDSGGPNGYYNNYEYSTTVICPELPGQNISVTFEQFSTESCCDALHIYDGNNTNSNYLGGLIGYPTLPLTFTATNPSGCLTFLFYSDGSVVGDGWQATVDCGGCIEPQGMHASDHSFSGITLGWSEMDLAGSFHWEVGLPGFTPGIGLALKVGNIQDNAVAVDGLASNTTYEAYVRSICGAGEVSEFAGPMSFSTLLSCGSESYDTGGPDDDYDPNEDYYTLLCPEVAGYAVTLDFTFFETQACCDFLEVLDGREPGSPSLGVYSGNQLPGTFTSSDATGCLNLHFTSDATVHRGGWAADIQCNPVSVSYTGNFKGNLSVFPNPVGETLHLEFNLPGQEIVFIRLTDIHGRVLRQQELRAVAGDNQALLDCVGLPAGTYLVSLSSGAYGHAVSRVMIN